MPKLTFAKAIRAALEHKLETDPAVLLLGQDIADPYGGAFRITRGLSARFPDRVVNTPISEAGTVAIAAGMALRGLKPVVEMMFGDFIALAADQLVNHAAKFAWMYNGAVRVPLVIRAPMGGRRGYGPTHSQSLERMFFGTPGLRILAPTHRHDPAALLAAAIDDPNPSLYIEGKTLYPLEVAPPQPPFSAVSPWSSSSSSSSIVASLPFPAVVLTNAPGASADLTVVTYGPMLPIVERAMAAAFAEDEVTCEIVAPSQIAPLDLAPIAESVARTGRLLVAEEGPGSWGWGAEVIAQIAEQHGDKLRARPRRVAALDLPVPTARPLEDLVLPGTGDIRKAIEQLLLDS